MAKYSIEETMPNLKQFIRESFNVTDGKVFIVSKAMPENLGRVKKDFKRCDLSVILG